MGLVDQVLLGEQSRKEAEASFAAERARLVELRGE